MSRKGSPQAALAAIKKLPVIGNAASDQHIFDKLHAIIADKSAPEEVRLEALGYIDIVMGVTGPAPKKADLDSYLNETA